MPRGAIFLLCAYLVIWVPLNFAAELVGTLPSLSYRGMPAILELIVHGGAAAIAFAAGWALWTRNQDAYILAGFAVALSGLAVIQGLLLSSLPRQTKPGDEVPLALVALVHTATWLWYLRRRARLSR